MREVGRSSLVTPGSRGTSAGPMRWISVSKMSVLSKIVSQRGCHAWNALVREMLSPAVVHSPPVGWRSDESQGGERRGLRRS